jgi:hypothetical protein
LAALIHRCAQLVDEPGNVAVSRRLMPTSKDFDVALPKVSRVLDETVDGKLIQLADEGGRELE